MHLLQPRGQGSQGVPSQIGNLEREIGSNDPTEGSTLVLAPEQRFVQRLQVHAYL